MVADLREAREREAMARSPRLRLEAAEGIDAGAMGAEEAAYAEALLDPQWMIAYKMFTDAEGEYGVAYPVPIRQFTDGANALVKMRRSDGGYAWTALPPERMAPKGTIECISEQCGNAHMGGRRKMLPSLDALIKHVRAFHFDDYETYKPYLDKIAKDLAVNNPRLQRLMNAPTDAADAADNAFYCDNDECTRFFDSEQGLRLHKSKEHKT